MKIKLEVYIKYFISQHQSPYTLSKPHQYPTPQRNAIHLYLLFFKYPLHSLEPQWEKVGDKEISPASP